MKLALRLVIMSAVLLGAATCTQGVRLDSSMNAALANDATVLIRLEGAGCTHDSQVGFGYCRKREGDTAAGDAFVLYAPPVDCASETSCVNFKFYFPDGSPDHGVDVPKGHGSVKVPWKALLRRDTFEKGARGFWPIEMRWRYFDGEGRERQGYAEGEIRMRVLARDYVPLAAVRADPNFAWEWVADRRVHKMSTMSRAYTGPE